jgi:hypothetical protein
MLNRRQFVHGAAVAGAAAALPEVMRGRDYIVRAGDRVLLVGYSAPAARFAEAEAAWSRIARTLRVE